LKRCGSSRHRLPLYPEQPSVTGPAAFLHKLDSEEINITLRLDLHPISACAGNLSVPLSRFRRTHRQNPAAIQFRDLCARRTLRDRSAGRLRQLELVAFCIHRECKRNSLGHRVHGNFDGLWFPVDCSCRPEHRCHVVPGRFAHKLKSFGGFGSLQKHRYPTRLIGGVHASGPKVLDRFVEGCVCPNANEADAQRSPAVTNPRARAHMVARREFITQSVAPYSQRGTFSLSTCCKRIAIAFCTSVPL